MSNSWNVCLAEIFNDILETELILTWRYLKLKKTLTGAEISEEVSVPSVISELLLLFPVMNLSQIGSVHLRFGKPQTMFIFCPC